MAKRDNLYLFSFKGDEDNDIVSINSLHVSYLFTQIDFKNYDYLIVTSKQAINALSVYGEEWRDLKVLAISNATAKAVVQAGGILLAQGNGYGGNLSHIICSYPKEEKWLYLRAREVASDFVSICRDEGYFVDEMIVYETSCSKMILQAKVQDDATLIFTSPSSIKCFLKNHTIKPSHRIIVIGKTTAQALSIGVKYLLADEPTIESCIKKAKE